MSAALLLTGCGTFGFFGGGGDAPSPGGRMRSEPVDNLANAESAARDLVRRYLDDTGTSPSAANPELLYAHPYYYRQFIVYPAGPDSFELDMRRTDSRTMPFTAEARYIKVRYATQLHRDRDDALAGAAFRTCSWPKPSSGKSMAAGFRCKNAARSRSPRRKRKACSAVSGTASLAARQPREVLMKHIKPLTVPARATVKQLGFVDVLESVVSFLLVSLEFGAEALLTFVEFKTQDNGTPQA
jgi:hypothetical protein